MLGKNQIVYSSDPDSTNSMNEGASVADDGQTMFLKPGGLSSVFSGGSMEKGRLTPHEAAEMFWELLISPLQR